MSSPITEVPPGAIIDGLRSLAAGYDVILSDVWGVIHDGRTHFAAACDALMKFRAGGGTVVLITNAPRPEAPVRQQLDGLGVPRDAYDALVTSGDVTLGFMAERGSAPLHHMGPARDIVLFETLAEMGGPMPELVSLEAADYVVCTGLFNDDVETPEDYSDRLAQMRRRDMTMICANPDLVVHVGDRLLFCAGALAAPYEAMGGPVLQAGKPYPPIYQRALALAAARRGKPATLDRVLAIGDAMRTDIAGANRLGVDALFVTSGIHRGELHGVATDGRAGELDRAAYAQFLEGADVRPRAAIVTLTW